MASGLPRKRTCRHGRMQSRQACSLEFQEEISCCAVAGRPKLPTRSDRGSNSKPPARRPGYRNPSSRSILNLVHSPIIAVIWTDSGCRIDTYILESKQMTKELIGNGMVCLNGPVRRVGKGGPAGGGR